MVSALFKSEELFSDYLSLTVRDQYRENESSTWVLSSLVTLESHRSCRKIRYFEVIDISYLMPAREDRVSLSQLSSLNQRFRSVSKPTHFVTFSAVLRRKS